VCVWGGGENRGQRGEGDMSVVCVTSLQSACNQWLGACGLQGGAPTAILGEQGGEELGAKVCSGCGGCASSPSKVCALCGPCFARTLCLQCWRRQTGCASTGAVKLLPLIALVAGVASARHALSPRTPTPGFGFEIPRVVGRETIYGVSTGQKRFPEHNGLPRRDLLC
jgi:hypothetical protein